MGQNRQKKKTTMNSTAKLKSKKGLTLNSIEISDEEQEMGVEKIMTSPNGSGLKNSLTQIPTGKKEVQFKVDVGQVQGEKFPEIGESIVLDKHSPKEGVNEKEEVLIVNSNQLAVGRTEKKRKSITEIILGIPD